MLYITYTLNFVLMIALPIALGIFLARRLKLGWGLWAIGAATFVLSQVVHIPLNIGLTALFAKDILPPPPESWRLYFNLAVLGLTAGLSEETARYLVYRFWIKEARTWREAVMFGAGHGGIEAIILGGLVALTFINMAALRAMDLSTLGLSAEQLTTAQKQLAGFWSAPWYATLLGAVERAFTIPFHIAMAVVVLQAVRRNNLLWLGLAVFLHATVNAVAVYALGVVGPYWTEAIIAGFSALSLVLLFALKPAHEEMLSAPVTTLPSTAAPRPTAPESDLRRKMDDSRFSS
jgi:uncharacterized membrane protein YhfC